MATKCRCPRPAPKSRRAGKIVLGKRSSEDLSEEIYRDGSAYVYENSGYDDDGEYHHKRETISKDEAVYFLQGWYTETQSRNGRYRDEGYDVAGATIYAAARPLLAEAFGVTEDAITGGWA